MKKLSLASIKKKLNKKENALFKKLNTPSKIQDFLDKMPFNFEERRETYLSPRESLKQGLAHCFEGAILALAALVYNGRKAFLLDLKTNDLKNDADHTVAVFQENGRWGAISKTNHPVLRWRDPIYPSVETLAYSYFHEYFIDTGKKTLNSYSESFDVVKKFGLDWITAGHDLDDLALALDKSMHYNFYNKKQGKFVRKASKLEREASKHTQWKRQSRKNLIKKR